MEHKSKELKDSKEVEVEVVPENQGSKEGDTDGSIYYLAKYLINLMTTKYLINLMTI